MRVVKPVELLPCPFCGNKDIEWNVTRRCEDEESSYVRCRRCGASVDTTRHQMMIEGVDMFGQKMYHPTGIYLQRSAIDLWNSRESGDGSSANICDLKAHIDKLGKRLAQVMRERDKAISDLQDVIEVADGVNYCQYCKHNEEDGQCHHPCDAYGGESGWEWRGVENE